MLHTYIPTQGLSASLFEQSYWSIKNWVPEAESREQADLTFILLQQFTNAIAHCSKLNIVPALWKFSKFRLSGQFGTPCIDNHGVLICGKLYLYYTAITTWKLWNWLFHGSISLSSYVYANNRPDKIGCHASKPCFPLEILISQQKTIRFISLRLWASC